MQIIFFCPPVGTINGGIRRIFRMVETLSAAGYDAVVFEEKARMPDWFASTARVVGQGIFQPNPDQVYVLPEDQPNILPLFKDWPQRKIIHSQNHFYNAMGLGGADSFTAYGIKDILCCSHTIYDHARVRFPDMKAYLVPCCVDGAVFNPRAKQKRILFMPRKRLVESIYLRDMFRFSYPECRDWEWHAVSGKSETEVAQMMGEAAVFLSLSRLEGLGLTPLETMAAGCVVAGFTGIGGREYATPENGFWADEDDFPACIAQLKKAVDLAQKPPEDPARKAYQAACAKTLEAFTVAGFEAAMLAFWKEYLGQEPGS